MQLPKPVAEGRRNLTKREAQALGYTFEDSILGETIHAPGGGMFGGGNKASRLLRVTQHAREQAAKSPGDHPE